ncbi:MAG: MFS transporter [Prolixibacteraceae bacterium]|nr:MFS transporter [Prolixibacteraceae bacterium]
MNQSARQQHWPVLLTTMFASFMNPFMLAAVNISLPDIQEAFSCSATTLSWVTNSFLLSNAIVLLPLSKAADIWGRVRFFKLGLLIFTIFTLLSAFSPSIYFLLLMRIFQGAGAAMMHVTAVAILTETYPAEKRGIVLGMNIAAVYAGLSLGPFVGGLLTQWLGWQGVFYVVTPLGLFSLLLAQLNLTNLHQKKGPAFFDVKGTILYALAIFAFIYGGGQIRHTYGIILTVSGILLMGLFFRLEKTRINPIFSVSLMKSNRRFAFSNYAALIHYAATFGIGFLLSLYLQVAKGLSPRDAGLILVFQPVVMAISAPFTGKLSDKIDPGKIASLGMLLTLFSLIGLMFLQTDSSLTYITTMLVVLGLGFGMFTSPNTNSIMSAVEKKDYGIASGLNATMRVFGQTLSMMVATLLISLYLGKHPISTGNADLFLQSMKIYFVVFSALCIPGIWFSLQRGQSK